MNVALLGQCVISSYLKFLITRKRLENYVVYVRRITTKLQNTIYRSVSCYLIFLGPVLTVRITNAHRLTNKRMVRQFSKKTNSGECNYHEKRHSSVVAV